MAFNFGSIATVQAQSSAQHMLTPWNIHSVKFAGCKVDHIKGKKDPSVTYDILKVRFENEDGYYEESIFFPKDGDDVRPTYKNKEGHDYEAPSSFERTMTFIAQFASVINPEGWTKMQAASSKFRSFDDVCNALIKITDSKKGVETHIKLIGVNKDGTIRPAFPRICGVSKEGQLFTSDNCIGDKLFFTPYEEGKRKEFLNAAPTPAKASSGDFPEESKDESDELNSMLADL